MNIEYNRHPKNADYLTEATKPLRIEVDTGANCYLFDVYFSYLNGTLRYDKFDDLCWPPEEPMVVITEIIRCEDMASMTFPVPEFVDRVIRKEFLHLMTEDMDSDEPTYYIIEKD